MDLIHTFCFVHLFVLLIFVVDLFYLSFKSFSADFLQLVGNFFRGGIKAECREISISSVRNRYVIARLHISHVCPCRRNCSFVLINIRKFQRAVGSEIYVGNYAKCRESAIAVSCMALLSLNDYCRHYLSY